MLDLAADDPGRRAALSGNEAIARGLYESSLHVMASYPGTPSTEITAALALVSRGGRPRVEWSANEKVAAETAIGSSMAGLRAATAMKGVGLNVAAEPLQAFTYMGALGGFVAVVADDPGCHSSHTEQDNRYLAREASLPILEPCGPEEAKALAASALRWSEEWGQPVLLRTTTVVSHATGTVAFGPVEKLERAPEFKPDRERWMNLPPQARRMRRELLERLDRIATAVEELHLFTTESVGDQATGVVAVGSAYPAVREALTLVDGSTSLAKLAVSWPLPKRKVLDFVSSKERVLVVEAGEPFVEEQLAALANKERIGTMVLGKEHLPRAGDISVDAVASGVAAFLGSKQIPAPEPAISPQVVAKLTVPRPPELCAGCGHRAVFHAIREAERKLKRKGVRQVIKPTDIGCYTLGYNEPLAAAEINLCMGASIGVGGGLAHATGSPVIATIGDSTFYHAGVPALLNAVATGARMVVIVLDNAITAMTGHQPNPGTPTEGAKGVLPEEVARACGAGFVRVVDPYEMSRLAEDLDAALAYAGPGPAVIVARHPCVLLERRAKEAPPPFAVDEEACTGCRVCTGQLGCPALLWNGSKAGIVADLCAGCGMCAHESVCRPGAIRRVEGA